MKKIKIILSLLVIAILSLSLVGCDNDNKTEENKENVQTYQQLENGKYTVLDVRETIQASHGWTNYIVSVILQDDNGIAHYYEYRSIGTTEDLKDEKYISLAKLVPNNRVSYENGNVVWLDDKYSLTHLFEGMTKEEWEELQKVMEKFFSSNKDTDMSELLKEHKEWYCEKCGSYNNPWPQNAKYCRNCGEKLN